MPVSDSSDGSVWLRHERPPRDRQLSRDQIVGAAVPVLDAEGTAACPCAGSPPTSA
ncbi:hypothetical protein ACFQ0B_70320 [Nonomuraea thailandensis]